MNDPTINQQDESRTVDSSTGGRSLTCPLCHHACRLAPDDVGVCHARANIGGKILNKFAGKLSSLALDPIEKKPLPNFHPGMQILSAGGFGCNMVCPFCQNASISQIIAEKILSESYYSPTELLKIAEQTRNEGNIGIAFTYNEPLINFEYILETFELAREKGLETILITNGCFMPAIVKRIAKVTTAWNIDLKCFNKEGYESLCGDFDLVKSTIEIAARTAHLEVTTLVIPGFSDDEEEMKALTGWLASLDPEIPYHLSRYFPRYKMAYPPPTPLRTMSKLKTIAEQNLSTVILGNV
ncbi:MAG TPA: radical SAM protein [Clostridiaceae bacterium]|nr:radical SAM protein [Clostridiaceae bacterium]